MVLLHLVLVEAALEPVPEELWRHPAVVRRAAVKRKKPSEILLDRSYHHKAMLRLANSAKRGRPDLVHFALLEATSTPLYQQGRLKLYVHTAANEVIMLGDPIRLPKSYFRFEGLMEQLFAQRRIRVEGRKEWLLQLHSWTLEQLVKEIRPERVIGLSRLGESASPEKVAELLLASTDSVLLVGGFPRGHFAEETSALCNLLLSIHPMPLEAHVVIARVLYEYEKQLAC